MKQAKPTAEDITVSVALGIEIMNAVFALQNKYPDANPRDMLTALVRVTCLFAAVHRIDHQSPTQMAEWMGSYIQAEFIEAHRQITEQRERLQPAG